MSSALFRCARGALLVLLLAVLSPAGASTQPGGCRTSGLCCQGKNMTCRVSGGEEAQLKASHSSALMSAHKVDGKRRPPMCFCDSACLELGDCCPDYKDACQGTSESAQHYLSREQNIL